MTIPIYFKVELLYHHYHNGHALNLIKKQSDCSLSGDYVFNVTEIQADNFLFYQKNSNTMELNQIYSTPNEQTWIYVKYEESVEVCVSIKEKLELDEENRRKKNLLLLKAKNMLINYESQKINDRLTKLIEMQYKLKQEFNNN